MALQNTDTCLGGTSPYSASIHSTKCTPGILRQFGATPARAGATHALSKAAKLTLMAGIAAGILYTWQGIALQVQKFSVRPDPSAPVTAMVRWMHNAWTAAIDTMIPPPSTYSAELHMSPGQLMNRWTPLIQAASQRFSVPASWIRAVVQIESGGRTMSAENKSITSPVGAMGLMQLMPGTYAQMRAENRLGSNAYNPRDNVFAGAAYLRWLYQKYGYPAMFAAYNDGPGHLEERLMRGKLLPLETRNYINRIFTSLNGGAHDSGVATFTRPNGDKVQIHVADATSVRAPLPGEYPSDVEAIITVGRARQAVRETVEAVKAALSAHGDVALPLGNGAAKLADLIAPAATASRDGGTAKKEKHAERRITRPRFESHHARVRLADSSTIHLHPVNHHAGRRG